MSTIKIFDEFLEYLERTGNSSKIKLNKPISHKEVNNIEMELGIKLPHDYVNFLFMRGTFNIDGDITGSGSGNNTELFSPSKIIERTNKYRIEFNKSKDKESREILNDGLVFCEDPLGEYLHLFVISSLKKNKEFYTRSFDYQDPANADSWNDGDGTFGSILKEILKNTRKIIE